MAVLQVVLLVILCHEVMGISDTFGTEFAFVFPSLFGHVDFNINPRVIITNQAANAATVTVTVPGLGFTNTPTIASGASTIISLPMSAIIPGSNGLHSGYMIFVTSTEPVSVVGDYAPVVATVDSFVVLPTDMLGRFYIAASYDNLPDAFSELVISALDDNTIVSITIGGQTIARTLNQYESYQIYAGDVDFPAINDVTGAFVNADKPVIVMSGHTCANIPLGVPACDVIIGQVPPLTSLGSNHVLTPFLTYTVGYRFRVIATLCETVITVTLSDGTSSMHTLQPHDFYESTGTTVVKVSSDNPVLVAQYCLGTDLVGGAFGDPCMIIVPATELFSEEISFRVTGITDIEHINIITECAYSNMVYLDNTLLSTTGMLQTFDGEFCVLRAAITSGSHSVRNGDASASLLVLEYGFNSDPMQHAHGHVAGFNLNTIPVILNDITDVCTDPGEATAVVTWTQPSMTGFENFDCMGLSSNSISGGSGGMFGVGNTTVTTTISFDSGDIVLGSFIISVQGSS
ncbi:uncharacterized protein [Amphiura filiformis]|uniref:uncharacterized protein n=1 Tax=Amphiura filiformis TaxID=82378 RepID=UPI003B224C0F